MPEVLVCTERPSSVLHTATRRDRCSRLGVSEERREGRGRAGDLVQGMRWMWMGTRVVWGGVVDMVWLRLPRAPPPELELEAHPPLPPPSQGIRTISERDQEGTPPNQHYHRYLAAQHLLGKTRS